MAENVPKLGSIIDGPAGRDAVHIAVAPVEAREDLDPGVRVHLVDGRAARSGPSDYPVGIVDPYLTRRVLFGEKFYLFLFPNTVTSLRHVWTHPAFEVKVPGCSAEGV